MTGRAVPAYSGGLDTPEVITVPSGARRHVPAGVRMTMHGGEAVVSGRREITTARDGTIG
jgi:hypothetical protein